MGVKFSTKMLGQALNSLQEGKEVATGSQGFDQNLFLLPLYDIFTLLPPLPIMP